MPESMLTPAEVLEAATPAAHSFAALPDAVLACIMQHVPLQQRLSRCALVCRSWATAAAAAPAQLDMTLSGAAAPAKCNQLQAWLGACRQQVVGMKVGVLPRAREPGDALLQLPCHRLCQLESLDLEGIRAGLQQSGVSTGSTGDVAGSGAGGSGSGSSNNGGFPGAVNTAAAGAGASTAMLPRLTQLRLGTCAVSEQLLLQLGAAPRLTRLQLAGGYACSTDLQHTLDSGQQAAAITRLLQDATGLRDLDIDPSPCTVADVLQHVSAMQHLHWLGLGLDSTVEAAALAALPVSLTYLELRDTAYRMSGVTAAAQLTRLTSLQQLSTAGVTVHPDAWSNLTWLRHLSLHRPFGDPRAADSTQVVALLRALGRLTQLQHLELQDCCLHQVQPSEGQPGYQCLSALTASSQLTALRLAQSHSEPLPGPAAVDALFPAGTVQPHLASLRLEIVGWHDRSTPCVGSAQVASIARACPALQKLALKGVTPYVFDTACLDQLPPGVQPVEGCNWYYVRAKAVRLERGLPYGRQKQHQA